MILNQQQLCEEARKSALNHDPYIKHLATRLFWRINDSHIEDLRSFVEVLHQKKSTCSQPAEEWLLDNAEFIEEQSLTIKQELAKKMVNSLPHLRKTREARIFSICKDYLKFTDGQLNIETFLSYIRSYQEVSILTIAEVWAVPLFMRMALIEQLAELMNTLKERHETCSFVDELLSNMENIDITPEALNQTLEKAGIQLPLSGPMIVHLVTHLRERADYTTAVGEWLIGKLEDGQESLDSILSYEYQLQASFGLSAGNLITSLRTLSRWNWHQSFEQVSVVEQTLRKESTGSYAQLDFSSRDTIRHRVEYLSRKLQLPENLIASQAVEIVNEVVKNCSEKQMAPLPRQAYVAYYFLHPTGIDILRKALKKCGKPKQMPEVYLWRQPTFTYFSMITSFSAGMLILFSLFIGWNEHLSLFEWLIVMLILAIPAMEWAITGGHWLIEKMKQPLSLLRYDFSKGVPSDAMTMVVIPIIWSSMKEVAQLADQLEIHYLANRDKNIHFALLGDFNDSDQETLSQDENIINAAKKAIKQLNERHPEGSFYYFQRKRTWNRTENRWMGWERKRGKLVEFVELIKGKKETSFTVMEGNLKVLPQIRYVITLDSDTKLPLESAHRMIGTIHFPYNQPRLNQKRTRVIEGYGILQPRISISYESSMTSRFANLWASDPGIDPYAFAVSDAYQDAFGQGIFTGKGIFDVQSFYEVLCERIPDNRVLSHDLLEGGFLRAGLLSDIELLDDHPSSFRAFQKRWHRWVRGDWQLLLWLLPQVTNRRGEKQAVDLPVITRWQIVDNLRRSLLPPVLFTAILLSLLILPGSPLRWILIVLATLALPVFRSLLPPANLFQYHKGALSTLGQVLVSIMTLPFQTVLLLDAIGRTLYRLLISKRNLLQWVPSAKEEEKNRGTNSIYGFLIGCLLIVLVLGASLLYGSTPVVVAGLLLAALWASAPLIIRSLNELIVQEGVSFSQEEKEELRELAREIWHFYEDYVTKEDHFLPPDNVQIDPPNGVAHRTSPTNIGLYLACTLAARDFEFIDTPGFILRVERTLDSIEKMEKWEGHLYNWYDTVSLTPLSPVYVSTVDSGNFVGCLITIKEGLAEYLQSYQQEEEEEQLPALHVAFAEEIIPFNTRKAFHDKEEEDWLSRGRQLLKRLETIIEETNFRPLYDENAKLFSLGYHVERNERDEVLYDLMASEARQASFIAIALGQVSLSHWKALGRTMTRSKHRPVLLSWSATMFEYLMPWIFMRTYRHSLWETTYEAVVERQIEYAEQRGVPFGISESGFYAFDYGMNYQYRAFGVPGLGFKRGLEEDLVIAPYATILALPFAKRQSLQALKQIEELDGKGKYGYYEAIDFTERRLPKDKGHMVIKSFMAHHQGMSFLTLANVLLPKPIYERFHYNKKIRSAELLLQERILKRVKMIQHPALNRQHQRVKHIGNQNHLREYRSPETETPEVCILSNGTFTSVVTNTGSGFSLYKGWQVSRWRQDPVMDDWGSYVYIRDIAEDQVWSPSFQPCRTESSQQLVQFGLDRASFIRHNHGIQTAMEVTVSPEYNAEIRRISLTNHNEKTKILEVTTFTELALSDPIADEAHTAFSKLFIRTEFHHEQNCLVAGRRPRTADDRTLWAAHTLMVEDHTLGTIEYETSRSSFIGRGHLLAEPQSIRSRLQGKVGSVADPAFIMRRRISVKPGETIKLVGITSVSETKKEAINIIRRFQAHLSFSRALQMAWTRSQIELRNLHVSSKEAVEFQMLAGQILYRPPLHEYQGTAISNNKKGQSSLWTYGLSGDRPIVLIKIENETHLPFVEKMLTAHEYLRRLGIGFDLVLLNESIGGYQQNLQEALQRTAEHGVDRFGSSASGIYTIPANQLNEEEKTLLTAVSRIILHAGGPSLKSQLRLPKEWLQKQAIEKLIPVSSQEYKPSFTNVKLEDTSDLHYYNGWGGFSSDGKAYKIVIKDKHYLPAPWINVLANEQFGCFISEMGTGYTWWKNSREFKLTPWSNDPVLDPPTETAFLRDEESGQFWSLTPSSQGIKNTYRITHGRGYTTFQHERNGIFHEMTVFVPRHDPVKIMKVTLQNKTDQLRNISLTYYAEWVLGVQRSVNTSYIVSEWDQSANVLTAKNVYQETFREAEAFLGIFPEEIQEGERSWTSDRTEFIGRNRTLEAPAAMENTTLSCQSGIFHETCGAVQQKLTLMPRDEQTVYILLGCSDSREEITTVIHKYRQSDYCKEALREVMSFWNQHLQQIQVSTPSQEMNILLNGWLLYQSLACRMWARTAFYQAGGAYGFRDQLQDSLAMLHTLPELTKKQILLHASHQYEEGDVQHWWHEETNRGIRTLFSDDLLWLPYTVSRYIEHTDDWEILKEVVPFLHSAPLQSGEHERYEPTVQSKESGTIYEHCLRAIDKALKRIGEHRLPLIGVGDWNDGMNLVGAEGRGESVWLGWFLCDILARFEIVCDKYGDHDQALFYKKHKEHLKTALNEHAWDGSWYRRARTDQGNWLGSIENEECQIDAIAQSWSIISGGAPKDRALTAMNSFDRELVDRELAIIRLLTPPFDQSKPSPGYIQGYPPGIRENGAQYTHGVIWGVIAWCQLSRGDKAFELFHLLNPINHTRTAHEVKQYVGEPYVMAADVYTAKPHEGHAGWTWYTGAASWMYQAGIEWILGIRRRGEKLVIDPQIPSSWPEFSVTYRYGDSSYIIYVKNKSITESETPSFTFDGKEIKWSENEAPSVPLLDDGQEHHIQYHL